VHCFGGLSPPTPRGVVAWDRVPTPFCSRLH